MCYAPWLALQVSRVSDFLCSMLSCFDGLRFPDLRLLDRLSDQLVDNFSFSIYTNKKNMSCMKLRKGCNAMQYLQLEV